MVINAVRPGRAEYGVNERFLSVMVVTGREVDGVRIAVPADEPSDPLERLATVVARDFGNVPIGFDLQHTVL